jgi:hypothetical protein
MTEVTTTITPSPLKDSSSLLLANAYDTRVLQPYLDDAGNSLIALLGTPRPSSLTAYLTELQWSSIRRLCSQSRVNSPAWNHLSRAGSVVFARNMGVVTVEAGDGWSSCALPMHSTRIRQPDCELLPSLLGVSKSIDQSIMGVGEALGGFDGYKSHGYCNHPNRVVVEVPRDDREKALEIIQSHLNDKSGVRRVYYGGGYTPAIGQYSPSLPEWDAVYVDLTCVRLCVGHDLTMLQWAEHKPNVPEFLVMAVAALQFREEQAAAGGIIHFKAVD